VSARALPVAAGVGAALMAGASWSIAALPVAWHPEHRTVGTVVYYVGLALLGGGWLVLGRTLLTSPGSAASRRVAHRFALIAAAPMLAAAPFGRDLWAYAAQGHLVGTGRDPYHHGPAAAPGRFADEVSARWLHTPSPYGPLWLRFSQFAAWASHGHPIVAALVLRAPAYIGLLLCCWAVGALATRFGARADLALWLGSASPLMTVLGVGGGHNDLVMLGLALAGLALAARPGWSALAGAAALASAGALIKSPAAIVVAFVVPVWLAAGREPPTVRRAGGAVATALASAVATVSALTGLSGLGFGWVTKVNSDAQWVSWLSLPSAAAIFGKWVSGDGHPRHLDDTVRVCRTIGEVIAVVALALLWLLAVRRARERGTGVGLLALALGVAAVLGPSVQPWYYLWALTVAGLAVRDRRALLALAAVPVVFTVMITPSGKGWESDWRAPMVVLGGVVVTALALRQGRRSPPRAREPVAAPPLPGR
jgi:alpha-1,6-mannosyltransferase